MPNRLPRIYRVDLTDKERQLFVKITDVAAGFMLSLQGERASEVIDADSVRYVMGQPEAVAQLVAKINRDHIGQEDLDQVATMTKEADDERLSNFTRIKMQLALSVTIMPQMIDRALYKDMQWLVDQLEIFLSEREG